ncbi:MAG TPA: hypothetical protein VHC69_07255 [Polyangiaceae bacterium]|nr:hypothetical protein [Polyangiaceae bacterium]
MALRVKVLATFCGAAVLCCVGPTSARQEGAPSNAAPSSDRSSNSDGDSDSLTVQGDNAIYLEVMGASLFYAVNYERRLGDFAGRIGVGAMPLGNAASSGTEGGGTNWALTVPVTISYVGVGSRIHMLELGAGATYGRGTSGSNGDTTNDVFGNAFAGYRWQPLRSAGYGGFIFRVGVDTILGLARTTWLALPWPYLSVGATFG